MRIADDAARPSRPGDSRRSGGPGLRAASPALEPVRSSLPRTALRPPARSDTQGGSRFQRWIATAARPEQRTLSREPPSLASSQYAPGSASFMQKRVVATGVAPFLRAAVWSGAQPRTVGARNEHRPRLHAALRSESPRDGATATSTAAVCGFRKAPSALAIPQQNPDGDAVKEDQHTGRGECQDSGFHSAIQMLPVVSPRLKNNLSGLTEISSHANHAFISDRRALWE